MKYLQIMAFLALCVFALLTACSCLYMRAAPADRDSVRLYVLASEEYAGGRFSSAAEILNGANKFPPALMLRAKAEYFSGDIEKAEITCRKILKIRKSSREAKLYLARCLREKGDISGAVKEAEALLADDPYDMRALRFMAEISCDEGRNDEAAAYLDKAAELSAECALVLLDRARMRWTAGKSRDALEDLARAKAMLPWDTPLLRSITNLENLIKEIM